MISGKEAKLAWANGEEVEYMTLNEWNNLGGSTPLSIFDRDDVKFKLKPQTITINGIEVPKPFEPTEGESVWVLSDMHNNGYMKSKHGNDFDYAFGAWRTEE